MQQEFQHIEALREIIQKLGAKRVLLVTGGASYASVEPLVAPCLEGVEVERFSDFSPNPAIEEVAKGIAAYRAFDPECVVAIGGGSVIDMAKSVNALAAQTDAPTAYVEGSAKLEHRGVPLIAIPTTAGSGSEATQFAVVYIGSKKYSLDHEYILPEYSIADSVCTYDLPAAVTAASGLDALCQGVESYWSVRSTNESKAYAREAITLALANLRGAIQSDKAAREGMMRAAHLAGKAINISRTTASHALSYPLTAHFGIPHGHAVALSIGQLIRFNAEVTDADCNDQRGAQYVRDALAEINTLIGARDAEAAAQQLGMLIHDCGLATRLSEFGIAQTDFSTILADVSEQRAANNPRRFTEHAVRETLAEML